MGGRSQQLRIKNNGKSTIPEDSDEKHYYYEYNIPRQLIYSRPRIFILGLGEFFYHPSYGSASSLSNGWVRGIKGSTSDTFEDGGAGGTATPVLLLLWVDRDSLQDRGILPFSSQRPPLSPGDKVGLTQLMDMPIFSLL